MPQELKDILLLALMNPATLVVGYWLGRRADQVQKTVIAGFAAGLAGAVWAWLQMQLGFTTAQPKLLSGILVVSIIIGALWAWLGYRIRLGRDR